MPLGVWGGGGFEKAILKVVLESPIVTGWIQSRASLDCIEHAWHAPLAIILSCRQIAMDPDPSSLSGNSIVVDKVGK